MVTVTFSFGSAQPQTGTGMPCCNTIESPKIAGSETWAWAAVASANTAIDADNREQKNRRFIVGSNQGEGGG
jgi:hypothetical protein